MDKHKLEEIRKHREEHKQMTRSKGWDTVFIIAFALIGIWFLVGLLRIYGG